MAGQIGDASAKKIAVVTGGNKGIGLEICRQLASNGVRVILTARDEGRGTAAVEELKSSGLHDVLFHQLDVADPSSVASLANFIENQFGKLDILINNAAVSGITPDPHSVSSCKEENDQHRRVVKYFQGAEQTYEQAEECLNINYYGMKRVTEAVMLLLQKSASPRIVNVSSNGGKLSYIPGENKRKAMGDLDEHSEERLDEELQSFLKDFKEGRLGVNGWPSKASAYVLSKVAMNTYTRILAGRYPEIRVNCVHPGFVKTDICHHAGILTVEEGARGPVMLALLHPDASPSGLFYNQTEISSFE